MVVCNYNPNLDRLVGRKEVSEILDISVSSLDRYDRDQSPERTFPRSRRIRGRRKWFVRELLEWAVNQ